MGENSTIQWTTHTWNPWRGCSRVSEGCRFCYAEAGSKRNPAVLGVWGAQGTRVVASESMWREPYKWDRAAREVEERNRVFCASLADVFEDWQGPMVNSKGEPLYAVDYEKRVGGGTGTIWEPDPPIKIGRDRRPLTMDEVRARVLHTIWWTSGLDYLLLTKRPENVLPTLDRMNRTLKLTADDRLRLTNWLAGKPPRNAWLGATVENRHQGLPRVEILRTIPATVRFLSIEPLLEDLGGIDLTGIHLVIIGGESDQGGNKARPFDLQWARNLIAECRRQGVAAFCKQLGSHPVGIWGQEAPQPYGSKVKLTDPVTWHLKDHHGGDWSEWPRDLRVREMPTITPEAP